MERHFSSRKAAVPGCLVEHVFLMSAGLLPTVTAMDCSRATARMKSTQVKLGSMHSMTISRFLSALETLLGENPRGKSPTGTDGLLNPRFVAEMMGFPVDWTEYPFANGGQRV